MNYFKYFIEEKIPYRIIVIALLLLNMIVNKPSNIDININEQIKNHKEVLEQIKKEPKILEEIKWQKQNMSLVHMISLGI